MIIGLGNTQSWNISLTIFPNHVSITKLGTMRSNLNSSVI